MYRQGTAFLRRATAQYNVMGRQSRSHMSHRIVNQPHKGSANGRAAERGAARASKPGSARVLAQGIDILRFFLTTLT